MRIGEDEASWRSRHRALVGGPGETLEDELFEVDPALLAPAKVELHMLQKEKAEWEGERARLEEEKRATARGRDELERFVFQVYM